MKKIKKTLAVLLAMLLVFTAMPMVVANAEGEENLILELNTPVEVVIPTAETPAEDKIVYYEFSPENDGWYRFFSTGEADPFIHIYNSQWVMIGDSDDTDEDYNFDYTVDLYQGYTYYIGVGAYDYGETSIFTVEVIESVGIDSVEITKEPDNTTVVEGYEEGSVELSGMEATVTFTDGEQVLWVYDDEMVGNFNVETIIDNDGQGHFYVDVVCGGVYDRFFFTTVENPVESIEYICGTDIEYYENTNGYLYDGQYFYYYDVPSDAIFRVNYKDGSSEEFDLYDDEFVDILQYNDDQYDNPWTVGADNYFIASYYGVQVKIPVAILECPFVNVTVDKAPAKQYVFGDEKYGYLYDGSLYYLYPSDISDICFTVEYEDGTKESFGPEDIDVNDETIAGYTYSLDEIIVTAPGTYDVTLNYKGYDIEYKIEVIESPVKGIKVVADPTVTEYTNGYLPVFDGMQIEITYSDDTTKVVTLSDENTKYVMQGDLIYEVTIDGYTLYITREYIDSLSSDMYKLNYLGLDVYYEGFTFVDSTMVVDFEIDNFATDGDGMKCTFTYYDDTQDEITLEKLVGGYSYKGCYEGYAMTKNGIAYYSIAEVIEDEKVVGYDVYVAHNYVYYELPSETFMLGDVDGDGKVTVMDATYIQRHLAKLETLEGDALLAADTYKDDQVTVLDATQIQRLLAKLITEF